MGPAATVDFYGKLVRATPAACDQDHLRVVIWSDSSTPDRTRALLGTGPDPTPWLSYGVRALAAAGAELITIPCNTAHAFLQPLSRAAGQVPILDMIRCTSRRVRLLDPPACVGLLATAGTISARLYHAPLEQAGIQLIVPDEPGGTKLVMRAIGQIKASQDASELLCEAALRLVARGARAIIAGCTEIALALGVSQLPVPLIDPAQILAEDTVAWARSSYPSRFRESGGADALGTRSYAG